MSQYSLIKLNATASTNSYLKDLSRTISIKDTTVVVAKHQFQGRGQQGATWFSEPEKSLVFSLYKTFETLSIKKSFYISMAVAVGIAEILTSLNISNCKVKWPNDIMSHGKKCGGILIENFLQRDTIKASIIGVGINVNNLMLPDLPYATSMKISTGKDFSIFKVLDKLVIAIIEKIKLVEEQQFDKIYKQYHEFLFMKNNIQVFEDTSQKRFNAIVNGVTRNGMLEVTLENDIKKTYDLKEVKFCF